MPRLAADDLSAVAGAVARSMQLVLSLAEEAEATRAVEGGGRRAGSHTSMRAADVLGTKLRM